MVMKKLRDPENGCPWDLDQTHQSIRSNLLEETYEALEALDLNNILNYFYFLYVLNRDYYSINSINLSIYQLRYLYKKF